ncbi:MAG: hypothetical protein WDO73_32265 [Ignavibacteriota bacterium]
MNFYGFHDADDRARNSRARYAAALKQILPVQVVNVPWDLTRVAATYPERPPYAINLIYVNPDSLSGFLRHHGPTNFDGAVLDRLMGLGDARRLWPLARTQPVVSGDLDAQQLLSERD